MEKINISIKIFCSLFLSSFTGLVFAQNITPLSNLDSLASQTLTEVVVTANRYGSPQLQTPEAIRVIDDKSIQKFQLRTAPEALLLTPGVFVQKTNHGGGSPFLRGLTGNQTLLLVDGIRLSNATVRYGPNQYFNTIDIFGIEKIEVLRGGGSVQYGSDAIGGTVQTFSRELWNAEKPTWESMLLTRLATQGMEQSLRGNINYSNKKIAFSAGTTWRNFGDLVGGDTTGRQTPTSYRELDFDLKGKISLLRSSSLTMAYQRVHQSHVPVFHKIALENYAVNEMDPQKRDLAYLRLNQTLNAGLVRSAVVTASYQQNEEGRKLRKNGSSVLRTENDKVRSFAFSAEVLTSDRNGWSANNGIEVYNDLVSSIRNDRDFLTDGAVSKRGLYPDGATMTSFAAFSLHTFDLQKWNITAGARYNIFINKVADETLGITELTPSALVSCQL